MKIICAILAAAAAAAGSARADEYHSFYISNHDQSPSHRIVHPIVGKTNFVYDAKGVLENIRGEAIAFLVRDSENVTIRNVRLDWERPTITEARVTGFEGAETIVEIDRARTPVAVVGGRLYAIGPGWTNEVRSCRLFDGTTREQTPEAKDISFNIDARECGGGRIALRYDFSKCGRGSKIGDILVLRPGRRDFPAMVVYNSKNVVFEDVVVHDAKGMALIAQRSENVTWRGTGSAADRTSGVFPRPGAYASAHADASHFSNVRGQVTVENCWFEAMMDDAINVHSTCLAVTNVSGRTLTCNYMHHQAIGFEIFRPGETLRFINGRTLDTGPEVKVAAVKMNHERQVEVTLAADVPAGWGAGDAVENADYQCAATFRGNIVVKNRARGTLFTTPGRVLVESNLFDRVTGAPLLFSGDNYYWYESGACRDVIIRGNVFSNCYTAAGGYSRGIISFYPVVRDPDAQSAYYHGNVLVEDNVFHGFDAPLLFALSVENLVWRRNRISYNDLYNGYEEPPYILRRCRNVTIDGEAQPSDTRLDSAAGRVETAFDDGWFFRKEPDAEWRKVELPHDWAIESKFDPGGEPGAGRLPYAGTGWYRKRFTLPADSAGQTVFLDVGGAMCESDVYLNGRLVGGRRFGFASYRVNLTGSLKRPGEENLIEIRCRVPAKSARFYFGAGLYRSLKLVRTSPVHVGWNGVCITTSLRGDGSAKVDVKVDVKGPLPFIKSLTEAKGKWGGAVRTESRVIGEDGLIIRNPRLWSPETPHLYSMETKVFYAGEIVDTVTNRFGVRTVRFDPRKGFFLNGKYRQMKGVCLHHDLGPLGAAFDRGAFERQIKIMKEMGADAIRTSHNPPAEEALDVCDEMGMLVMDEAFDCWRRHKFPADYATHFDEWHSKDFADFVKRDRNHPSVVMWSIGNEIPDTYVHPFAEDAFRTGSELTRIAHKLDPTRPTTMGHCRSLAMTNGMARATDIFGANYLPGDYAWYLENGEGPLGLIATETCSAVSTRGEGDLHVFRRNNCLPEAEFAAQAANPACYGEFVWTGFDYLGEPDPFAAKGARSSYYGIVDLCGFPKERYWTYRKRWRPDSPGDPDAVKISKTGRTARYSARRERFRSLVYVEVRAVDEEGAFVAKASDRLHFKASGPWKIVGVCNGDPMDYDSLKGDTIRLFNGMAQVVLRLDGESDAGCELEIR